MCNVIAFTIIGSDLACSSIVSLDSSTISCLGEMGQLQNTSHAVSAVQSAQSMLRQKTTKRNPTEMHCVIYHPLTRAAGKLQICLNSEEVGYN